MADAAFFNPGDELAIKRRREYAKQLMQASQQPQSSEVVGGYVVPQSPLLGLSRALSQGIAGYESNQADAQETEMLKRRQEMMAQAVSQLGTDPQAAAGMLMQDPSTAEMGMKIYTDQMKAAKDDADWQRDANLKRELKGIGSVVDPDTGEIVPMASTKPLPVGALKLQAESLDALAGAEGIAQSAANIENQINTGALNLGPIENLKSMALNKLGMSTENSRNFQNLDAALEKIRNDSLRLNKGVQTEGDAQRAMQEVIDNKNDPQVMAQALQKLQAINQRAAELQRLQVNQVRTNYGAAPMDFEQINTLPSVTGQPAPSNAQAIAAQLEAKGVPPERIQAYLKAKGLQ